MKFDYDVCISGSGIVGKTLALALAREKLRVALVQAPATASLQKGLASRDVRAYALNNSSQRLLQGVRCWPAAAATPIEHMRVWGDGSGALAFEAASMHGRTGAENASQPLGWIVDVPVLEDMLAAAVQYQPQIECVSEPVAAHLLAVCEGKNSMTRATLGVDYDMVNYPQHAIAARLRSNLAHQGTARQWFCGGDIVALLPLGGPSGDEYALVWSTAPETAQELKEADEMTFIDRLQAMAQHAQPQGQSHDVSGNAAAQETFALTSERACWPLRLSHAKNWTGSVAEGSTSAPAQSWVLLGDAAHTVHPLSGSGLNLGLGDVQELARQLGERQSWRSPADLRLLRNYERARKSALLPFLIATDGLQQLFSRQEALTHMLRNWGMSGVNRNPSLKAWLARQAMSGH